MSPPRATGRCAIGFRTTSSGTLAALSLALAAPADASTSDAVNAVNGFDPRNPGSFERLEQVIDAGGVNVAGLRPQLRSSDADRRWAAAYVGHNLARTAGDVAALRERARDRDPSVRALANIGLLRVGEVAAIPRLIALLRSRALMRNGEPPEVLADLADAALEKTTSAGLTGVAAWTRWWRRVRARIAWDPGGKGFLWPGRPRRAPRVRAPPPARATANDPLTLSVDVQLRFASGITTAQRRGVRRAFADAERFLNGSGRTGMCTPVSFDLSVREGGDPGPATFVFFVDELQWDTDPAYRRSFVQGGRGRLWTGDVLEPGQGGRLVAHESAHVLGLPDEYLRVSGDSTVPFDSASFLSSRRAGDVLQRHLDALVRRSDRGDDACERWLLSVTPWESRLFADTVESGSTQTNFLGVFASANIGAELWLDPATGRVTPAGRLPCGQLILTAPCGDSSRNSEIVRATTDPGRADCTGRVRFKRRFDTKVTGERSGGAFRLRLAIDDEQRVTFVCVPAAEPEERTYRLIANGMKFAGATRFTVPMFGVADPDPVAFSRNGERRRAAGTIALRRVPFTVTG